MLVEEEVPTTTTPNNRLSVEGEYLIWWLREGRVPALLTTSSAASHGLLGAPDTSVLFGDERLTTRHDDRFFGTRVTVDYWLDEARTVGLEARAVFLERDSTYFKAVSDGSQLLARPYFDAQNGEPASKIVAGPVTGGVRNGGFVGYTRIEFFSEEGNLLVPLVGGPGGGLDLIVGARFLQMRDRLDLTSTGRLLPEQTVLVGLTDQFRIHNEFYGGQLGLRGEYDWGRWFVNLRGEAALGGNVQTVRAWGDRTNQTPTQKVVLPYGLAVLPSNTGTFERAVLDSVFDFSLNLGYRFTDHWRGFVGYSFLLWTNPIRAGDQVDLVVNPTQLTGPLIGPARPSIPFREDLFWAQGVNLGLELRW